MSQDFVSLNQNQNRRAYHTLSLWEQEIINDFIANGPGPAAAGIPPDMTDAAARAAAAQLRRRLQEPDADRQLLQQSQARYNQQFKGRPSDLSDQDLISRARRVLTEWTRYLAACGGYYTGRGPGP